MVMLFEKIALWYSLLRDCYSVSQLLTVQTSKGKVPHIYKELSKAAAIKFTTNKVTSNIAITGKKKNNSDIYTDLSTWEQCRPWDFDHNSIQNAIILGDAVENCHLPHNFLKDWPSKSSIATEVVLPWVYWAITKIKHLADGCSKIFTLHSSSA